MARKPRLDGPGCLHHVMGRGNAGGVIFEDDEDRQEFLRLVGDGVERFGHSVHAYCLMGNHFHLLIRTGKTPLSVIMQNLMFRYTRHVNRRTKRYGHLFQGRFKSVLVDEQSYLLELVRYIHLNPVRAGLAKRPEEWRWSGHLAYLGRRNEPFLDTEWVLGSLGGRPAVARRRYAKYVNQGIGQGRREEFHRGGEQAGVLGDGEFLKRMHLTKAGAVKPAPGLEDVVAAVCGIEGLTRAVLIGPGRGWRASDARALVGLVSRELKAATLTEVAKLTGRDVATLSRTVGRFRKRLLKDKDEARKMRSVLKTLAR